MILYWSAKEIVCNIPEGFGIRSGAPFQYPISRLIVRSREVSKTRDRVLKCSYRFEIRQAHRQQCCRCACQISKRSRLRDFARFCDRTSYQILKQGPGILRVDKYLDSQNTVVAITYLLQEQHKIILYYLCRVKAAQDHLIRSCMHIIQ